MNVTTQRLFSGEWVQAPLPTIADPTRPTLRPSQRAAVKTLKDKRHVILNAPTGWGKSLVIVTLILCKLLRNPQLRCVIAVPQTLIGRGFVRDWTLRVAGKLVEWTVLHNLCHTQASNTVDRLIAFLKDPVTAGTQLGDRVLLCSHATLALVYTRLKESGQQDVFNNLVLWLDEGHHVMNAEIFGSRDTVSNTLGSLVRHCVAHGNNHVGLATATYHRGDRRHILPGRIQRQFAEVGIPYDLYLAEVQPIETFQFNIVAGDTLTALDTIFETVRPTIIYLAKRNSRYASPCKTQEVKNIVERISKRLKLPVREEGVLTYIGQLRVLDLVDEAGRKDRKAYLDNGGQVDMIIALETCKEGFDWPAAERSIILGERHSITEMVQMIGRLFRRAAGKTHAEVFQILPAVVPDAKKFKEQRNSILTVIFAAMLLEDVFLPLKYSEPKEKHPRDITDRLSIRPVELSQDMMRDFLVLVNGRRYEETRHLAATMLARHGVAKADALSVWDRLWRRFALLTREMKGLRLDVSFEVLKTTQLTEGLLTITSGLCGLMTFQALRCLLGSEKTTLEEYVLRAERLAAENVAEGEGAKASRGVLPTQTWLRNNGEGPLAAMIDQHPEAFAHIKQQKGVSISQLTERLAEAERLVAEYGYLPQASWLERHGFHKLVAARYHRPDKFQHFPKEENNLPKRLAEAERLVAQFGFIPSCTWLQNNGYMPLYSAQRYYKDAFSHFPREPKNIQVQVAEARELVREFGGIPGYAHLKRLGKTGVYSAMREHPELFADCPRLKPPRPRRRSLSVHEQVAEARELVREYGSIPCFAHLAQLGKTSLYYAMRAHPTLFADFPRAKPWSQKTVVSTAS